MSLQQVLRSVHGQESGFAHDGEVSLEGYFEAPEIQVKGHGRVVLPLSPTHAGEGTGPALCM